MAADAWCCHGDWCGLYCSTGTPFKQCQPRCMGTLVDMVTYKKIYLSISGLVGLAISYALSVTNLLSGVVTSFTETEKQMVSVERMGQYIHGVPTEKQDGIKQVYTIKLLNWLSLKMEIIYGGKVW